MRHDIEELLILVGNIERLLGAGTSGSERNQVGEVVAYIERISPDGSITALANNVVIALAQRSLEGPFGVVAVMRALAAVGALRSALLKMKAEIPADVS